MVDLAATCPKSSSSYDKVPYESGSFPQTHPDRLATLGRLFGMTPSPITHCRVLELGCAGGGNLIPMAFHLPKSDFVGVDLAARHVETGCRIISDLTLDNIRIEHASIMDIDESWGKFDYIICHGVYSWVSADVRKKILDVSSVNLSPQGIAYISYNTYPGWHMREMIRHMMLYHANQFEEHEKRIEQARALMQFLAQSVPTDQNPYGMLLRGELSLIQDSRDYYLFHEHLEEVNAPFYFHQFMEQADQYGLQYLGEADFNTMLTSGFSKKVADTLNRISQDIINTEQYMDFARNRFFRQTLLCHKNHSLTRELNGRNIDGLLIASSALPQQEPVDFSPETKQFFINNAGSSVETAYPLTKAAMTVLRNHWPEAVAFDDLFTETKQRLEDVPIFSQVSPEQGRRVLADDLLHCYTFNAVELHTWQADLKTTVSQWPKVSALAIRQAAKGSTVVNQRHENATLDPISRQIVPFLDGTNDHAALMEKLKESVAKGKLTISQDDKPVNDQELICDTLQEATEKALSGLAESGMLVT